MAVFHGDSGSFIGMPSLPAVVTLSELSPGAPRWPAVERDAFAGSSPVLSADRGAGASQAEMSARGPAGMFQDMACVFQTVLVYQVGILSMVAR